MYVCNFYVCMCVYSFGRIVSKAKSVQLQFLISNDKGTNEMKTNL